MVPREARLAPSSLRRALRTLGPLTLLVGVVVIALLGLLAQSASADHPVAPPSINEGATWYGTSATPTWTFTLTDSTHTASCTLTGPAGDVPVTCTVPAGTAAGTATPDAPLVSDGSYALAVTQTRPTTTDESATPTVTTHEGGTSAPATSTYVLDRVAPVVSVQVPSSANYAASTGWTVGVSDSSPISSITCTLSKDGGSPSPVACAEGAVKPALSGDGDYVLAVTATDAASNSSGTTSSGAYTYDGTPPVVSLTRVTASPDNVPQPEWTYTVTGGGTPSCVLSGPDGPVAGGTCGASGYTAPTLTVSGSYTLTVSSTDGAGNTGSASSSYTLDLAPPSISISGPTGGTSADTTWNITITDGTFVSCGLAGATSSTVSCTGSTGTVTASRSTDGTITLTVVAEDAYGNSSSASATYTRTTTPDTPGVSTSPTRDSATTITWTVTIGANTETVTCALTRDGAPATDVAVSCPTGAGTHTVTTTLTTDGVYRLTVTASNSTSPNEPSSSATYELDTSAPAGPAITSTHTGTTGNANPLQWTFAALTGHSVQCRLTVNGVAGAWGACTTATSHSVTPSAQGSHQLSVRYVDDLGNPGEASSSSAYLFDDQAPAAPGVTRDGPAGPRRSGTSVTWQVTAPAEGDVLQCRLLAPGQDPSTVGWDACDTTITRTPSGEGVHTLQVRYVDAAGNLGAVAESTVEIDDTPPGAPGVAGPATGATTDPQLAWTLSQSATDPGVSFECLLHRDGAALGTWTACTSNYSTTVTQDGTYVLHVRAVDVAGNRSAVTLSSARTVDRQGPAAPGVTLSPDRGRTPSATWTITPAADADRNECRLGYTPAGGSTTWGSWATCAADGTYALTQGDGGYVLEVRSYDALDNLGATTTGPGYTLDATPPGTPTVTGSRTGTDNETAIDYTFAHESGGTATCRLYRDGALVRTIADCHLTTPLALDLPRTDGSYVLGVTLTDSFGNDSSEGRSAPYVLDVTPPATPEVVGSRTGTDNERTLTYAFSGEGTAVCRLYADGVLVRTILDCHAPPRPLSVTLPDVSASYVLTATFTDAYGNVGSPGSSAPYVLDVTPPDAAVVTVTPRTGNTRSATWTVTLPEAGATTQCRLHKDGVALTTAWQDCAAPYAFSLSAGDGVYVLEVRVVDAVGNVGDPVLGESHTLDTTPPAVPTVGSDRTVADNERTVTYTFAGEGTARCTLRRDGVVVSGPEACSSSWTVLLPDVSGRYVLHVTYTDAVGNESSPGASPAYDLDVTPPATPAVAGSRTGTDNERAIRYTFTGEGTATCQLTRDGAAVGAAVPCTSPWSVELPAVDGSYALLVTFTDAVGNVGEAGSSAPYLLDLTGPTAPVVTGPPATGNSRSVTWTYAGEGTATCTLRRDGQVVLGPFGCDATSHTAMLSADGTWTLEVVFTDAVGNLGTPGRSSGYLLDTVAPAAPTATGPTGPAQGRTPSWTLGADSGTTLECRLVRAGTVISDWATCAGSVSVDLAGLPDGGYSLEVRATDVALNVSAVGASAPYVLDTTAPAAPIVSGPTGPSRDARPRFTWTGEAGAQAQCQLSREGVVVGAWFACTSGQEQLLARDGTWTVAVRLVDAAGNVGEPAASNGYLLDTTAPATPVVTPPKTPGRDTAPAWSVGTEQGAALECRFTGETEWTPCTAPHPTSLTGRPDGPYTLEVRATDAAGNVSATGTGTYVLDTVAPAAATITAPPSPSRSRTPTFTLATEPGATTRCRLTSGSKVLSDFMPCAGQVPVDLTGLPDGTYTLTVRITDEAGNPGPAATSTYVLDTTAPAAPVFTASPASPSPARSVTWAFSVEPGSTLVCRLTFPSGVVRELTGCASPLTVDLTGLPDGTYTLVVRAVDAAGNVGVAGTEAHVLDSAAAAAPVVTGPATPASTRTPTWRVTGPGTLECRLTRGTTVLRDWIACGASGTFTADLFGQPDGSYLLSVRSRDAAGGLSAVASSRYVLDTTAPGAAALVEPPTPSTNRMPTWTVASAELGATAECRVLQFAGVLKDWHACAVNAAGAPYTLDLRGLGDGAYTLVVRLTDAAGNRSTVEARSTYVLDTSAPVAVGVIGPPSPGNEAKPTWLLSTSPGVRLECRLTRGDVVVSDWDACAEGSYTVDLTGQPDGPYLLSVRAVSEAGTPGPETGVTYEYKTSAPGAPVFVTRPESPSKLRSPRWVFTLPAGSVSARCTVVEGTRVVFDGPCSTDFTLDLSDEPQGTYTLSVVAVDAAGNTGVAATSAYKLDTTPKAPPTFTATPGEVGSTLDPQWRFTVPLGGTAQCRLLLNGAVLEDWRDCADTHTVPLVGRPDGTYTLQVRTLSAGNTSEPREDSYRLDRTALPIPVFKETPQSPDNELSVVWTFSTPTSGTFECRLLGPAGWSGWSGCTTSSGALSTAAGGLTTGRFELPRRSGDFEYRLEVRFVDPSGATGAASTSYYRLVTAPPPRPTFTQPPAAAGSAPDPRWLWVVPDDEVVECQLRRDGAVLRSWADCGSFFAPDLTELGEAVYTLDLRRVDRAGNRSAVTSASYEYDRTAPAAPVLAQRPSVGGDRRPVWAFAVPADVTATCVVSRGGTPLPGVPCSGRFVMDLVGQPDGVYTLTVRFRDAAGNVSATSATYTLTTLGSGPVRVEPVGRGSDAVPPSVPSSPSRPSLQLPGSPGPGRGGTSVAAPIGSSPVTRVPTFTAEEDLVRGNRAATASQGQPDKQGEQLEEPAATPIERAIAGGRVLPRDVPEALRGVVTETFKRPTLPLALLAIVVLFLLAQNRIDRRDPKLAAAPVDAEPELDFTVFIRRPGGAVS